MLACAPSFSADSADQKTTGKDVGKKIDETAQTIKNYSAEQRDEALKSAKSLLADADAHIDQLESDMNKNWDKMSASARKHAQETMRTLRRQRQDLSQSYGEAEAQFLECVGRSQKRLLESYEALRDSFAKGREGILDRRQINSRTEMQSPGDRAFFRPGIGEPSASSRLAFRARIGVYAR
jgi:hypothetical protein